MNFLNFFTATKLSHEAVIAYFNKLPDSIVVSWKRDSGFIIGEVKAGEKKFITQGEDVKDFIRMVNESVYTVFDIPLEYMEVMKEVRPYNPNVEELKRLYNGEIPSSNFLVQKDREVLEVAK